MTQRGDLSDSFRAVAKTPDWNVNQTKYKIMKVWSFIIILKLCIHEEIYSLTVNDVLPIADKIVTWKFVLDMWQQHVWKLYNGIQ